MEGPTAKSPRREEGKNPPLAYARQVLSDSETASRRARGTVRDAIEGSESRHREFVLRQKPTLNRAWPRERPRAAMCVRSVDDQGVLQFTLIHAVGCVLHRRGSRAIHRLQLFLSFQLVSRAGERREASTDPSLEWSGKEEKRKKRGKNPGGRGPQPKARDSLERADRAACHRPTRTRTFSTLLSLPRGKKR